MIKIFLGNLGSGKSVCAVRELMLNQSERKTYTNLMTNKIKNVVHIKPQHVIRKFFPVEKKGKPDFDLNLEYWQKQKKPLNILWDEIHLTAPSRASSSKINMVLSRFIAMARRITGMDKRGYGHFTFIAQKERTIDVNIKELTNEIRYHISHWVQRCEECGAGLLVNSEMQIIERCMQCGSWKILKEKIFIEVLKFNSWEKYYDWALHNKSKRYFERYIINDIQKYFKHYDTLQMSDLWDSYIHKK